MRIIAVLMVALAFSACSKKTEPELVKPEEVKVAPKPSTIQTAVEGFTGHTAVKQGKKAQEKIIDVSETKNKELDEVLQ